MSKLTVGSLKFRTINTHSIDKTMIKETRTINKTSRRIDIKQNHRYYQVEVKKEQSILEAALEQRLPLDYKCKKGTCGKCKVMVVNGRHDLQHANSLEVQKLNNLIERGFRLACQAKVRS